MSTGPSTLVVSFSRTGNTAAVARSVADRLDDPVAEHIQPTRDRGYRNWLARSFVPGSRVPIHPPEHDPRAFDVVFLGTPKWTLSCPPVNAYLRRVDLEGAVVGLFLTFGGFDEDRYARRFEARLRAAGASVPAALLVKRDRIGGPDYASGVDAFVEAVLARLD